jgi:outer membrane PBP1 activator LpoA protein
MQSVVVKFRNRFAARVVLFIACALALAGCETDATGPTTGDVPRAPVANSEPMTHSRAARECWMRTEKANAHENLDKRAELVNKCIDEKLKAAGVPSPRT